MKWPIPNIGKVADINPRKPRLQIKNDSPVSFVPMAAVSEISAEIEDRQERPFAEVCKGFTYFEEKDVLFAKITPCMENGKVALAHKLLDGFGFGSTEFHVLRTKENMLEPEYLLYFLRQENFRRQARQSMTGAVGQQRVPKDFIEQYKIPLPPPSEQRQIVEILDQADRLRKLRAMADKKAERSLPALFIKMFGDPATNPMGWQTFELRSKKFLNIKGGGTPIKKNPAFWNGSIPWVSPKDMKSEIIQDTEDHVTKEAIQQSSTNIVSTNSILLVVRSGILAHTVPIALAGCDVTLNQDMKSFTVKDENELNALFLFGWMKSATNSLIRGCIKFGATVHSIDMSRLGKLKVIKPPIEDQNKFALQFQRIFSLQRNRTRSSEIIDQLFNTILHRAFTGDLTASWRQAHMKELLREMELQAKKLAT